MMVSLVTTWQTKITSAKQQSKYNIHNNTQIMSTDVMVAK